MNIIILANSISLIGALVMVGIGVIKSKKKILIAQVAQFTIMGIGNLLLGGVTAFFSNLIAASRNIITFKFGLNLPIKIVFIIAQLVMGIMVNDQGLLGWLPIAAAVIFTWFCDLKDDFQFKLMIIGTLCFWLVYDFIMMNYSAFTFDVFSVITNIVGIYRIKKSR